MNFHYHFFNIKILKRVYLIVWTTSKLFKILFVLTMNSKFYLHLSVSVFYCKGGIWRHWKSFENNILTEQEIAQNNIQVLLITDALIVLVVNKCVPCAFIKRCFPHSNAKCLRIVGICIKIVNNAEVLLLFNLFVARSDIDSMLLIIWL